MLLLDHFPELKEVFMQATLKIVNEIASRVPIVRCLVEDFELNECSLACLDRGVVLISWVAFLLWTVFYCCKCFNWVLLCLEERAYPAADACRLFLHFCELYLVFKLYCVVLSLLSLRNSPLILCRLLLDFFLLDTSLCLWLVSLYALLIH